jgi:hypothetical protein
MSEEEPRFVLTWRLRPPNNCRVLAREGASYFDAAYSAWRNQWFMLANGREEKIESPTWWRLTPEIRAQLDAEAVRAAEEEKAKPAPIQCTRRGQFLFDLSDSGKLSRRAA